ncbi:MAG: acetyl-CoA carboxylase biotin carboxyl carrier protein subunit [Pedobacter sp.]|nr:acetyl-CoA carboxylase biotin carboxyl carrier protein subunit [Pedobacter sp.]
MYKVKVNEKYNFEISGKNHAFQVNEQDISLNIETLIPGRSAHVLYNNKSYTVEIVEVNAEEKTQVLKVNGNLYTVGIEDKYDLLLKKLGMEMNSGHKVQEIKAPMPGLVLKVMVQEGTSVKKGDNLLVLEAMKMENILKSPTEGIVNKVLVQEGDKTEKNSVLIQFK